MKQFYWAETVPGLRFLKRSIAHKVRTGSARFIRLQAIQVFYFMEEYGKHKGLSSGIQDPFTIQGTLLVMPTSGNIMRRGTGRQPMAPAGDAHHWI